jgi:hypothetical protein
MSSERLKLYQDNASKLNSWLIVPLDSVRDEAMVSAFKSLMTQRRNASDAKVWDLLWRAALAPGQDRMKLRLEAAEVLEGGLATLAVSYDNVVNPEVDAGVLFKEVNRDLGGLYDEFRNEMQEFVQQNQERRSLK